jgi:pyrimidine operon attenuation protein/uracil phosphoribosyltransferase
MATHMSEVLFNAQQISDSIQKLTEAIAVKHLPDQPLVLVGVIAGGVVLAKRLGEALTQKGFKKLHIGKLDATFYRDDLDRKESPVSVSQSDLPTVEDLPVILCDDVLSGGRTIRAALNAIMDFGRPALVELCVLIDRGGRELPIAANYVGMTCEIPENQRITVRFQEIAQIDEVIKNAKTKK